MSFEDKLVDLLNELGEFTFAMWEDQVKFNADTIKYFDAIGADHRVFENRLKDTQGREASINDISRRLNIIRDVQKKMVTARKMVGFSEAELRAMEPEPRRDMTIGVDELERIAKSKERIRVPGTAG